MNQLIANRKASLPGIAVLLAGSMLLTAERASQASEGTLAALPSKPGPHVAKIKALGDNEWISLGQAEADSKWGVARGRAWGSKMAQQKKHWILLMRTWRLITGLSSSSRHIPVIT